MFEEDYKHNGPKKYIKAEPTNRKRIVQCDGFGNYINTYESVTIASEKTGIARTRISSVLINATKHAGGFIFVYEKDFPIKDLKKYKTLKKGKRVAQLDPDSNEIIEIFDRISDAGKKLNVNYKAIHKVIDKDGRTAYGFKWISQ